MDQWGVSLGAVAWFMLPLESAHVHNHSWMWTGVLSLLHILCSSLQGYLCDWIHSDLADDNICHMLNYRNRFGGK